jgi:signal transduction histidine kinase
LENTLDTENAVIFSPASASLMHATMFVLDESGKILDKQHSGYLINKENRDMNTRLNSFLITLAPKEKVTLLLKTDSRGRHHYIPFFLDNVESYWEFEVDRAAVFASVSTVLGFSSLFAILLSFYLRERVYITFSGYVMACLLLVLEEDGYAYFWFYGSTIPSLSTIGIPLFGLLTCALLLRFNMLLLKPNDRQLAFYFIGINTYRVAIIWTIALLGGSLLKIGSTANYILNLGAFYLSVLSIVIILLGNFLHIRKKWATYILFSNLVLIAGLLLYFLNIHGVITFNPFNPNGLVLGALFNVLAFTFVIGYRYYSDSQEKKALLLQLANKEKAYLQEKFQVQEQERQRIARDLHDDLGALLAMIKLKVENAAFHLGDINGIVKDNITQSIHLLKKASKDVRFISHELLPEEVDQKRFKALVEDLFLTLKSQDTIQFDYEIGDLPKMPLPLKANLFRIIKELLNNIIKHARATKAKLTIGYESSLHEIHLTVYDNGRGFDWEKVKKNRKGIGLNNLQNRTNFLNGKLEVMSGSSGTTIRVNVPLEQKIDETESGKNPKVQN